VIPSFNYNVLTSIAEKEKLFTANALEVIAVTDKNPYLILVELRRTLQTIFKNSIAIKDTEGNFTPEYIKLTKEFYLKF
jgi:tRNA1(Val) A37 N6-methylase TrmN6